MSNVGFQSQQFGEQVAQRRQRSEEQIANTWQTLPIAVRGFQDSMARQQQIGNDQDQHQLDMALGAQRLGQGELVRQNAIQELQIAKELHSTDMIAAQKRTVVAQAALAEAQAKKQLRDLEDPSSDKWLGLTYPEQQALIASGIRGTVSGGRIKMTQATDEEAAAARKYLDENSPAGVARIRSRSGSYQEAGQMQRDYLRVLDQLNNPSKATFLQPGQRQELERQAEWLKQRLNGQMGATSAPTSSLTEEPAPTPQTQGASPSNPFQERKDAIGYYGNLIYQAPDWQQNPFWKELDLNPATRAGLSSGLAAYAHGLIQQRSGQGVNIDPQIAHRYAMQAVQQSPAAFAMMLRFADYPDEQIRLLMRSRFHLTPDAEKTQWGYVESDTKRMLEQLRKAQEKQ